MDTGQTANPPWTSDTTWAALARECRAFSGRLKVLELCSGLGTASLAAGLLLGHDHVEVVGLWDTDADLAPLLSELHGQRGADRWHLGVSSGDILARPVTAFPDAHLLVAGPPCPPWSGKGRRGSFEDPRASVFWRVVDVAIEKANRPGLLMFVLENVQGITHKPALASRSPASIIIEELRTGCPGWTVELALLNARDFGLPQSRPRAYVIGRRAAAFPVPPMAPHKFRRAGSLGRLLDWTASGQRPYTALQQQNIAEFKARLSGVMDNRSRQGQAVAIDVSRTPSGRTQWGAALPAPDVCECLTAAGPQLHVFALGWGAGPLNLDRPMLPTERAAVQGFPLASFRHQEPAVVRRAVGNAMAVSVIGSVLACLMQAFLRGCGPAGMQLHFGAPSDCATAEAAMDSLPPLDTSASRLPLGDGACGTQSPSTPDSPELRLRLASVLAPFGCTQCGVQPRCTCAPDAGETRCCVCVETDTAGQLVSGQDAGTEGQGDIADSPASQCRHASPSQSSPERCDLSAPAGQRPAALATPPECPRPDHAELKVLVSVAASQETDYVPCAQGSPRATSESPDRDSSSSCEFPQMVWKRARK